MIAILEQFLLALTDAQFDRVLVMISEGFRAVSGGIQTVWNVASPLLIGLIALQLAKYDAAARTARKKIIEDLTENTKVSSDAFDAANSHNAKIADLMAEIAELKKNQK